MKRIMNVIKRFPTALILWGIGLVIDNWRGESALLILPGFVMITLGLDWLIESKIKDAKDEFSL